jgi:hypothetical protein
MAQKSTERTPRKSAPDVLQAVTGSDQQVFFYRLAVFFDE